MAKCTCSLLTTFTQAFDIIQTTVLVFPFNTAALKWKEMADVYLWKKCSIPIVVTQLLRIVCIAPFTEISEIETNFTVQVLW